MQKCLKSITAVLKLVSLKRNLKSLVKLIRKGSVKVLVKKPHLTPCMKVSSRTISGMGSVVLSTAVSTTSVSGRTIDNMDTASKLTFKEMYKRVSGTEIIS
jgi:hypothetical protein